MGTGRDQTRREEKRRGEVSSPRLFASTMSTNHRDTTNLGSGQILVSPSAVLNLRRFICTMAEVPKCIGSTSTCSRVQPGVFLKSPMETGHEAVASMQYTCSLMGIQRYLGKTNEGLLLGEAILLYRNLILGAEFMIPRLGLFRTMTN